MKILILPSWYSSYRAPSRGSFVTEQAVALAKRGHDVVVAVFDRDSQCSPLAIRRTDEHGLSHIRISVPSPLHRLIGFYAPRLLAWRLSEIIDSEAPDVVHAHAVRPAGVIARLALEGRKIPWCITEHSAPLEAFWKTCHGYRQIDTAYGAAHGLFGVSDSLTNGMRALFPEGAEHAMTLYNGIDTELFRVSNKRENGAIARLLFVGELSERKGVSDLLKALKNLPKETNWNLSLVGEGRRAAEYRAEAEHLQIASRLDWLGTVPREAMPQVYQSHDLLVVSSLAETFSLVSAEALACGLPVVATRCGGPEEILGPLGLPLVVPGDPMALSVAIQEMLGRLDAFDRAAAAISIEARFSMANLAAKLDAIYNRMLQELI